MTSAGDQPVLSIDEVADMCRVAILSAGGSTETASVLANATAEAEMRGKSSVGVAHLFDYLDGLRSGRINPAPSPIVERRRLAAVSVDADEGIAQLAFERGLPDLLDGARECGVAVLSIRNAFSAGELAYYTSRVGAEGFVALGATASPALMAAYGSRSPVTGTNPLSFALPHPLGPRVFDQASSEVAWVSVRDAADRGEGIPAGAALDERGEPTEDASAGLRGSLLAFGGVKGANIAVMVEMLAALAGGSFSVAAAPFDSGSQSPALGLTVLAIDPAGLDPDFAHRAEVHHQRMADTHGVDFGRRKTPLTEITLDQHVLDALRPTDSYRRDR
jgi:(2R)-3-sulfolactate dehydrogenase (NADP+)